MTHVQPHYYIDVRDGIISYMLEIYFRPVHYDVKLPPSLPISYRYFQYEEGKWGEVLI